MSGQFSLDQDCCMQFSGTLTGLAQHNALLISPCNNRQLHRLHAVIWHAAVQACGFCLLIRLHESDHHCRASSHISLTFDGVGCSLLRGAVTMYVNNPLGLSPMPYSRREHWL